MSNIIEQIEALSHQASRGNPALNQNLSTDLMNNTDMLLMRHKMSYPQYMPGEAQIKVTVKARLVEHAIKRGAVWRR